MGSLKVTVKLDASGPLADGSAEKLVDKWLENTTQALGDKAVDMLRAVQMDRTGRATGAFQGSLQTVRKSLNVMTVPGPMQRGVVWSPWLEGSSKRNEDTGFKGYGLFRKTRLALQKQAPDIGQRELDKLIGQMGGE